MAARDDVIRKKNGKTSFCAQIRKPEVKLYEVKKDWLTCNPLRSEMIFDK